MNTTIIIDLLRGLTGAGYLDIDFLIDTIDKHHLDINEIIESIEMNFGKEFVSDFNYLVYETLSTIANNFISENEELFGDDESKEYEVFTNYLDSHICFTDEDIQNIFEEYY